MKYLPFENITYHTQLSADEVLKRLSENLEPREFFPLDMTRTRKIFAGYIEHNGFNISRLTYGGKFGSTVIKGKLYEDDSGTVVKVKMRLLTSVRIFMTILCSLAFIGGLIFNPLFIFGLFMTLIIYGVIIESFNQELIRTEKHFVPLFEAEIRTPNKHSAPNKKYKK